MSFLLLAPTTHIRRIMPIAGLSAPALLLFLCFLPPYSVQARPTSAYLAEVRTHGVELSLSLPRHDYPQDALVRVTVRLENISRRVVQVGATGAPACDRRGPGVLVSNASHQILYPPAITWLLPSCGPYLRPRSLRPGRTIRRGLFAILRGNQIQAIAAIGNKPVEITTPPLTVTLRSEPAPHLILRTTAPSEISISSATPTQRGSFYYITSEMCVFPTAGPQGGTGSGWGMTHFAFTTPDRDGVYRFASGCEPPTRWSFVGGWLNHPVATIEYIRPGSRARK